MADPHCVAKPRVLMVGDESDLFDPMVSFINLACFSAHGVGSLHGTNQLLREQAHHILVLDLGLPDGDWLLWLAARSDLVDKRAIINRSDRLGLRGGACATNLIGVGFGVVSTSFAAGLSGHRSGVFMRTGLGQGIAR